MYRHNTNSGHGLYKVYAHISTSSTLGSHNHAPRLIQHPDHPPLKDPRYGSPLHYRGTIRVVIHLRLPCPHSCLEQRETSVEAEGLVSGGVPRVGSSGNCPVATSCRAPVFWTQSALKGRATRTFAGFSLPNAVKRTAEVKLETWRTQVRQSGAIKHIG